MKLTDDILKALQRAISTIGSVDAAAKRTNVKTETLSDFMNRSTSYIRKETWEKLFPLLKPYMPPDKVKEIEAATAATNDDPPELPVPPSHARVHHDLASLSSDEKILLDAFNDLPPELQQQKLLELTELAKNCIINARNN